ncbi:hypothetical protein ACHAXA_003758 [Cyclostephanos tholiformis]|uniref:Uncharacterized protein n=1 Tax=Cyclostephanos tholiformis TaxID=382380 RepID=A0ABD3SSA1_9STRA
MTAEDPTGDQRSQRSQRSKSSKASSKSKMTAEDIAAMRHLRSVVESITVKENIMSQAGQRNKINSFNELLMEVEQRLHYNEDRLPMSNVDPLELPTPKKSMTKYVQKTKKKKKGWLKSAFHGKQDNSQINVSNEKKPSKNMGGVLETLTEELDETRDDIIDHEKDTTARDETDSIIKLRLQNSEAFLASVCSLRSLGTFEKDFINNIIADQAANGDMISVSTFEKDYMTRMNNDATHPTQVFFNNAEPMDDLTVDTLLSETTFENDARAIMTNGIGVDVNTLKLKLPTQVTAQSGKHNAFIGNDDLSIDTFRSETTYERDQRKNNEFPNEGTLRNVGSAPTTFATFNEVNVIKDVVSDDSQLSVSTYEKDMAALTSLAHKIGRKPSTQPKDVMTIASDRSCSTFEQDVALRNCTQGPAIAPSDISESTFMTDYGMRFADPHSVVSNKPSQQVEQISPDGLRTTATPSYVSVSMFMKDYLTRLADPQSAIRNRPSQQRESMSPLPSPKTEPNSPQSTPLLKNVTESHCVDRDDNPGWFKGIKESGSKRDNAGRGSGAVYVLEPASIDRNRSLLSAAARQANCKVEAMDAATRISKITPLEVQVLSIIETEGAKLDTAGAKSKEQGSVWGRFLCQADNWFS